MSVQRTPAFKRPFSLVIAAASVVLAIAVALVAGAFSTAPQEAYATGKTGDPSLTTVEMTPQDANAITRAQWIARLVDAFDMTIEAGEDEYPDDYFEDVTDEHANFLDIMKATDFGVIDTPAGESFSPDGPATREFAAHTLNYCLGYQLDEGVQLEYSDEETDYPEDMQVSFDRSWFGDSKVDAKANLSADEANAMIADAEAVLADTAEFIAQDNDVQLAAGVKVVPAGAEYDIDTAIVDSDGDGEPDGLAAISTITIQNCPTSIAAGDLFAVYSGDIPVAFKALAVRTVDSSTIIEAENAGEEAYSSLAFSSEEEFDLADFQEAEGVTTQMYNSLEDAAAAGVETGGFTTQGLAAQDISYSNGTLSFSGGVGATNFTGSLSGVKVDYVADKKKNSYYVAVNGTIALTASLSGKAEVDIPFGYATAGIAKFFVGVKAGCEGSITETVSANFEVGAEYNNGSMRMIKDFTKGNPGLHATASAAVRLEASASAKAPGIDAYLRARLGYGADYIEDIYNDGMRPNHCEDFEAHLFADAKANATLGFGALSKTWKKEYVVWDAKNSPVRMHTHIEDGSPHDPCSRGKQYDHKKRWGIRWGGFASSDGSGGGEGPVEYAWYEYDLDDAGNAIITKYHGNYRALIVPETVDGHTVVGIGEDSFAENGYLTSVVLPSNVTYIGWGAFRGCQALTLATLPANCKELRESAFKDCTSLVTINLPKDVNINVNEDYSHYAPFEGCESLMNVSFASGYTRIAEFLFEGSGLTTVTIPDTVTVIERYAFKGCTRLGTVNWGKALTEINNNAFESCTALTSINLPDSLRMFGCEAFQNCTALASVRLPKNVDVDDLVVYGVAGPFDGCSVLKTVQFANGYTTLANGLFKNCGIEEIALPDTIVSIGQQTFEGCDQLTTVQWSESLTSIYGSAFADCTALTKADLPDSLTYLDICAFANCDALTEIYIPENLTTNDLIDYGSSGPFAGCDCNARVTIAEGRKEIPLGLFKEFYGLTEVTIPSSVKTIGRHSFDTATSLKKITIPSTVIEIQYAAFADSGLTEISLPDSVTTLEGFAFANCQALATVKLPNAITEISDGLLYRTDVSAVSIPDTVTRIGSDAFGKCNKLTTVNWGAGIVEMGDEVFRECAALETVSIPATVRKMGHEVFYDCDALTTVVIPSSVIEIGDEMFYDCDALTSVTLGMGINRIPAEMFKQCDKLEAIVLPWRVESIDDSAFAECVKLTSVTIPQATESIADDAFSYPTKMTVYGKAGTYAQEWANDNGARFVAINKSANNVTLSKTEMTMYSGDEAYLFADVEPADFTGSVTWKVTDDNADEDVVWLDEDRWGCIHAEYPGTATVKFVAGEKVATCSVTVIQSVNGVDVWIEGNYDCVVDCGDKVQMSSSVWPDNASDKTLEWSTSDPSIATVDQEGNVTTLAPGKVTIKATATDRGECYGECEITVRPLVVATSVDQLESTHPYENDFDGSWRYTVPNAESLVLSFDSRTMVEDGSDYIYVYDGDGEEVGSWSGDGLAGQEVTVPGDTVKIRLVSDSSLNDWGFKVVSATGVTKTEIAVPKAATGLVYNGKTQTGVAKSDHYTVSGGTGKNAGSYKATVTAADGYIFANGETTVEVPWSIAKAASSVKLAAQSKTYTGAALAYSGTVTKSGSNGKVTYKYYSDSKCTKQVAASSVKNAAVYYVRATVAADANFKAATSAAVKFTIGAAAITTVKPKLSKTSVVYTGKALKPGVSFSKTLTTASYKLTYANNTNIGTATVTVTGKGNYKGTKKLTFKILPAKAAISKVVSAKQAMTVTAKAQKGGVYYQFSYRLGSSGKWVTKNSSKATLKIAKLKSNKNYQVRVRAYKKVGATTYYGAWSAVKTVKVS